MSNYKPSASEIPPAHVVFTLDGRMTVPLPLDNDIPDPTVRRIGRTAGKLANGLTPRADAMCRLMARGASAVDAHDGAYGSRANLPVQTRSAKANKIANAELFKDALVRYRDQMEKREQQQGVGVRNYVMSRLVHESQTATESASRIRALDLLGKSEAMWTTVHRTEQAMTGKDIDTLRHSLEARMVAALARLRGLAGPHPVGEPLECVGTPVENFILTPSNPSQIQGPLLSEGGTPLSVEGPPGSLHRGMLLSDLM